MTTAQKALRIPHALNNHLMGDESVPISLLVDADFLETVTGHGSGDAQRVSVYSPELQLLTESEFTSATPAPAWDYVYFAGQPVAQIEVATGATRWTFNDHLGTPVIQTDAAGAVVWRLEQEPYGDDLAFRAGSSLHQPLRFPGQERRVESELAYNVFRWYRGGWGRYTQADPIGIVGGMNVFTYASAAPVAALDPLGLVSFKDATPHYHPVSYDEIVQICPDTVWGQTFGCTLVKSTVSCRCERNCDGASWSPRIAISIHSIDVYYATNAYQSTWTGPKAVPPSLILSEEKKHVAVYKGIFNMLRSSGEKLEKKAFSTWWQCKEGCDAWESNAKDLVMGAEDWVHENNPHPKKWY